MPEAAPRRMRSSMVVPRLKRGNHPPAPHGRAMWKAALQRKGSINGSPRKHVPLLWNGPAPSRDETTPPSLPHRRRSSHRRLSLGHGPRRPTGRRLSRSRWPTPARCRRRCVAADPAQRRTSRRQEIIGAATPSSGGFSKISAAHFGQHEPADASARLPGYEVLEGFKHRQQTELERELASAASPAPPASSEPGRDVPSMDCRARGCPGPRRCGGRPRAGPQPGGGDSPDPDAGCSSHRGPWELGRDLALGGACLRCGGPIGCYRVG